MKTKLLLMSMVLCVLAACDKKQEVVRGESIIGHWEETDPRDAQYQPVELGYIDRLFIESDATWKSYRDDVLTGEGNYTLGHTDDYISNGERYGAQDSIVFVSDGKTQVEYYIYDKTSDQLKFTGNPGLVGQPFKVWKRIK